MANLQNNIGVIIKSQGHYEQALEWFQKALQGYEALKATPGMARVSIILATLYRLQGRYDKAFEPCTRVFSYASRAAIAEACRCRCITSARLYEAQGKYAEMLDAGRRAAKLAEELSREEMWTAQDRIGRALACAGPAGGSA